MTHTQNAIKSVYYLIALILLNTGQAMGESTSPDNAPVKFGFTKSMFVDLNAADTRAAVKSYAMLLASNNDLTISDSPGILDGAEAVQESFAKGTADIISLTTIEFLALPEGATHPRIICASMGGTFTEQYVLLVHKDSGIQSISDLKNRRLLIYSSLRGSISPLWLDVLLATNGSPEPAKFFSNITPVSKPTRTVLPVFFHQADACIVTQNGYNVICELNPQVMRDLKIIATSPPIIPSVTCFRAGIPPLYVERILNAVVDAQHTVSGRQVLTIFQCDRINELNKNQISTVRELLATQARLRGDANPADSALQQPSNPSKTP